MKWYLKKVHYREVGLAVRCGTGHSGIVQVYLTNICNRKMALETDSCFKCLILINNWHTGPVFLGASQITAFIAFVSNRSKLPEACTKFVDPHAKIISVKSATHKWIIDREIRQDYDQPDRKSWAKIYSEAGWVFWGGVLFLPCLRKDGWKPYGET